MLLIYIASLVIEEIKHLGKNEDPLSFEIWIWNFCSDDIKLGVTYPCLNRFCCYMLGFFLNLEFQRGRMRMATWTTEWSCHLEITNNQ